MVNMPGETQAFPITDEGRRLSDAVDLARLTGGAGRWIAARLSDGGTDGQVYDTRADAVRHQLHEEQCAYLLVPPAPMPPAEATAWLALHRRMYAAGYKLSDPAGGTAPLPLAAYAPLGRAARRLEQSRSRRR